MNLNVSNFDQKMANNSFGITTVAASGGSCVAAK
jgi:hypothetical protein